METGDTCLFRHRHMRRSCFRRAPWAGPRRVRTWRVGPHGPVLAASARGESAPLKCLGVGGRGGEAARLPHRGLESGAMEEAWMKKGLELGSV